MRETFSNRWTILLAALGMAIGTGNIWRFPRMAAKYGSTFILLWLLFLFTWSIPLLLMEFSLGEKTRRTPVGAFIATLGPRGGWMGGFITLCSLFIMAYYSVVAGWCLKFLTGSILSSSSMTQDPTRIWEAFIHSPQPLLFHVVSLVGCAWIVSKGIVRGVERINKIFVPMLFLILLLLVLRSLTLPGAGAGVAFLFHIHPADLLNPRIYLEAISQSAWSTGAGWGLILVYAGYIRKEEDITLTTLLTGLGNNVASILAALAIIPALFALVPAGKIDALLNGGNVGLIFITLPRVFGRMPLGEISQFLFFTALTLAAYSSLIAMIQLGVDTVKDLGGSRRLGLLLSCAFGLLVGAPSALSLSCFNNQDWVWGVGLIISGGFLVLLMERKGLSAIAGLVESHEGNLLTIPRNLWRLWFLLLPVEWLGMILWWAVQSISHYDPKRWWHPFHTYSLGTCLFQWGVLLIILFGANALLARMAAER